jgi:hypothetical protein
MPSREVSNIDSYSSKLAKLIPAEVSAAYLAINSLVPIDLGFSATVIIALIILTILCPLYLWILQNVRNLVQIGFTTAAFPLWALNMSYTRSGYLTANQYVLGVILILATLIIPFISPSQKQGGNGANVN